MANLDELGGSTYDLILMEPPWSNKHVKRAKKTNVGYQMMDNDDLAQMPVRKLLKDAGLLFVWCTNKVKHRAAVRAWFGSWGVTDHGGHLVLGQGDQAWGDGDSVHTG